MFINDILISFLSLKDSKCKHPILSEVRLEAWLDTDSDIIPRMGKEHFKEE